MSNDVSNQTVVAGEASESDDDDFKESLKPQGVIVAGEASESEESDDEVKTEGVTPLSVDENGKGDSVPGEEEQITRSLRTGSDIKEPLKFDTLLHRKLREKNISFRRHLYNQVSQTYMTSAKDLHHITQGLLKSQTHVQDVSHNLRLMTNNLFQLQDKVDIITSSNVLPEINIAVNKGATGGASPGQPKSPSISAPKGL
ncbi:unnamed protein product [Owenia fusiformis]|uniref:Biogenesis of lysosome-related organelles complex 1 subunit 3 n=1 Tax=Owenia fusiformis TaxID=6347 RepID=A0A8J1TCG9_OWEFU|nr:unnamed protein product [Owenia fusiformis]